MPKVVEIRCKSHMHGKLLMDEERIEFKCTWGKCGARPGTVVLHYFDIKTGEFLETKKFSDPTQVIKRDKEKTA